MTLPPDNRILGVDMYRATALSMVLWLGLLEATEACGEDECNWTQPLHYFEQLSGLFFLLSGLGETASAPPNKRLLRGRHTEWSDKEFPCPPPTRIQGTRP